MAIRKWKNPSQIDGKNTRVYNIWLHMRNRCTDGSRSHKTNPTYIGCNLYKDWYDYDIFHTWVMSNKFYNYKCRKDFYYQLDKDLLIKHNKVYSPDTCEFLPKEINTFLTKRESCRGNTPLGVYLFKDNLFRSMVNNPFTGKSEHLGLYSDKIEAFETYKKRKEFLARYFCEVYMDLLPEKVEAALMNYTVNITD